MISHMRFTDGSSRQFTTPLPPAPSMVPPMAHMPVRHLPAVHASFPSMALPPLRFHSSIMPQQQQPSFHRPLHLLPPPPQSVRATSLPTTACHRALPPVSPANSDSSHKCSLAFILSGPSQLARCASDTGSSSSASDADSMDNEPLDNRPHTLKHRRRATATGAAGAATGSKSKYCTTEGCTSRAKHARKCWRHGGSVKCKVPDCINRAKSRGVCWSHGGGTTCSHANCGTIAVSHGFCWAHGGGKRCQVGGCSRPAYERTENLCSTHFKQQKTKKGAAAAASVA